jgi:hypothetical protein
MVPAASMPRVAGNDFSGYKPFLVPPKPINRRHADPLIEGALTANSSATTKT